MRYFGQHGGLIVATAIWAIWLTSLICLISIDFAHMGMGWRILAFFWQMFTFTGLFITAHDAMHGVVSPDYPRLNDRIGALCLGCYALFSFSYLKEKHFQHHHFPASHFDPDFHNGHHPNFFAWYFYFMQRYWSWRRLIVLMVIFNVLNLGFHIPEDNLKYFWVFPSALSSLQLFFFGTYLPHRKPKMGYTNSHRAETSAWPAFWSFVSCYHFGYHEEHHTFPHLAWWQLPQAHRQLGAERKRIASQAQFIPAQVIPTQTAATGL
jgi:beta-carotene/zeaxanthin 4-ketolase